MEKYSQPFSILLDLRNPDDEDEDIQKMTQMLRKELLQIDEIIDASLVADPNPPAGSKAFGAVLLGLIAAQITPENIKTLFGFLSERFSNKPITFEVEANGRKLKVCASSQQELQLAMEAAQKFVNAT